MLAIVNVSTPETAQTGFNDYEVRINKRVIAKFTHDRQYLGAAQCLRDAADAVEKCQASKQQALLESLLPMLDQMSNK